MSRQYTKVEKLSPVIYKRIDKTSRYEHIIELIIECQRKSKCTYGYKRIWKWLNKQPGIHINKKAVLRLMRMLDLWADRYCICTQFWTYAVSKYLLTALEPI